MRIFITGGTGYVGGAIVAELVGADHRVVALVRSEEGAARITTLGAEPHLGDLGEPDTYAEVASEADAVIHAAFDYRNPLEADQVALDALLQATADRESVLVYTSGVWVVGDTQGKTLDEEASTESPASIVAWRVPRERRVLEANGEGRCTAVLRPGVVYGHGQGSTARMFATTVRDGEAEFVGDGTNHWSMIHVEDLASLYRQIVEGRWSGTFHGVDGAPVRLADVAAAASEAAGAGGATRAVPVELAREKLGPLADAYCLDQKLDAPAARTLGWAPLHPSFPDAATKAFRDWSDTH